MVIHRSFNSFNLRWRTFVRRSHKVKKQFFDRCKERNYNINLVSEVWRQIESFANYAFAKGHSASYAVESYQSLFLKAYYPLEYMVATINNFGGFYSTEHYIQEARLKGASIVPPCINEAQKITTIKGKTIMLGFQHIKNLDNRVVNDLLFQRTINGPYNDLEDFVNRVSINLEMLINLIRVNAFRFTGIQKTELLWKAHFMLSGSIKKQRDQASLFDYVNRKKVAIPSLTPIKHEDAYDDIENFGFPLCSPFDLIERKELEGTIISKRFKDFKGRKVKILGYLVHQKKNMTRSNDPQLMSFGTFMDYAGEFYESVHFPDSLRYYKFKGKGIYQMEGRVTEDFGHYSLDVIRMTKLAYTKLVDEV